MKQYLMRRLLKDKLNNLLEIRNHNHKKILLDEIIEEIWSYSNQFTYQHKNRLDNIDRKLDQAISNQNKISKCEFRNRNRNEKKEKLYFNVGSGDSERNKAVKHLKEKTSGAKHIIICDPYFLKPKNGKDGAEQTAREFLDILPLTLDALDIYVKPRIRDPKFTQYLNKGLSDRSIRLIVKKTDKIHDRVWIKDHDQAFIVGTSFNGLGNKCTFILDLPPEDKRQFLASLYELSNGLPLSKSA